MRRLREASGSASPPSTEQSAASCSAIWRRHFAKSRGGEPDASSRAKRKPCWRRQPVHAHRAALYRAFPADEARRVLRRLEFHYVPKHASWLNMVEIEIG